jgi:hypothetical protein
MLHSLPSHPPWFCHRNNVWWSTQVMKLLIMQSSSASRHILPLGFKYSPQHPYNCSDYQDKAKGKVVLCLTKRLAMKTYWCKGGTVPRILDLGTRWGWVVSFMPPLLYPQGKSPRYPLDRRLGGPQSRSGRGGEEINSQPPPAIEP